MTAFLYRLGRFAHRHPWRIVGAWIGLLLVFAVAGFGFGGKLADSFTIPGTESQAALDRLDAVFPQAAGGSAQAVLVAPAGHRIDDPAEKAAIGRMVTAITKVPGVESAASPFSKYSTKALSSNHRAAIVAVQFRAADSSVTAATKQDLKDTGSIGRHAGMQVAFSGQAFQQQSVGVSYTEGLGLLFAGVVLVVTFGSLLAAGLPLVSAILGVALSVRRDPDHRPLHRRVDVRADPRAHAGARRRHRLRPLHHLPAPGPAGERDVGGGVRARRPSRPPAPPSRSPAPP